MAQKMCSAMSGNRTRVYRVAGGNSTTGPTLLNPIGVPTLYSGFKSKHSKFDKIIKRMGLTLLGGLEPPTLRLTAVRASRLCHRSDDDTGKTRNNV